MKSNKAYQILITLLLIAVALGIIYPIKHLNLAEHIIRRAGLAGPIVSVLLYGVFAATPVPTDALSVINGIIYGPILGSFLSWLGNNLAALVEYYLGKQLKQAIDLEKFHQKLPLGLNKLDPNSTAFLLIGRIIPWYGGKLVSFWAGSYNVPLFRYFWTSATMNLIGAVSMALAGHGLHLIL